MGEKHSIFFFSDMEEQRTLEDKFLLLLYIKHVIPCHLNYITSLLSNCGTELSNNLQQLEIIYILAIKERQTWHLSTNISVFVVLINYCFGTISEQIRSTNDDMLFDYKDKTIFLCNIKGWMYTIQKHSECYNGFWIEVVMTTQSIEKTHVDFLHFIRVGIHNTS